ncbi:MAG: MFS transporter [Nocardioides sp.]|uniref:MFS transporter n=1 Tax=Nocardioides sp. TaxID=35761 RepID=UPI0039E2DF7D
MTSPTTTPMRHSFREPMRDPAFDLLVSGQVVSQIGDAAFRVALILYIVDYADSPGALGIVTASFMIPNLLLFSVSGLIVDRFRKRLVMISSDVVRMLAAGAFAVLASVGNSPPVGLVAVLYALFGVADAFFLPAYRATIPELIPPEQLYPANAIDMIGRRSGLILGPVLSAFVIATGGPAVAFWINTSSFAVSVVSLLLLEAVLRGRRGVPVDAAAEPGTTDAAADDDAQGFLREATEGVRFLWRLRWLGLLTVAAAVVNAGAAGAMDVALPYLVRENFGVNSVMLGISYAIQAGGAVAGAIVVGRMGASRPGVAIGVTLGLIGLSVTGYSTAAVVAIFAISSLLYGFAVEASGVHWTTLFQLHVPQHILGRVGAADYLISYSLMPLAVLLGGVVVPSWGPGTTMLVFGVVMAVFGVLPLLSNDVRSLAAASPPAAGDVADDAADGGAVPEKRER